MFMHMSFQKSQTRSLGSNEYKPDFDMNTQIYSNRTSDVTLSNMVMLLEQEVTFIIVARTQPVKGCHHAQLCKKQLLVVLIGVGFVLSVLYHGCE